MANISGGYNYKPTLANTIGKTGSAGSASSVDEVKNGSTGNAGSTTAKGSLPEGSAGSAAPRHADWFSIITNGIGLFLKGTVGAAWSCFFNVQETGRGSDLRYQQEEYERMLRESDMR